VLIPSLSLVLCCFSFVLVCLCLSGSRVFFFRDSAVITHCRVSGLIWDTSVFARIGGVRNPSPTDPICAIPLHHFQSEIALWAGYRRTRQAQSLRHRAALRADKGKPSPYHVMFARVGHVHPDGEPPREKGCTGFPTATWTVLRVYASTLPGNTNV
jgi:hypothetical protein